jgi:uncharacterized membrane protein YfcA
MDITAIPWADLAPFIIIGFSAQLVDSALGLAFGIISNSLLVLFGLPPTIASATVRSVEGFTTGASGISHILQRNVDWPLFARLVVPGVIGGLIGIWVLTHGTTNFVRATLLVYLLAVGVYLLWRAPRRPQTFRRMRHVGLVGLFGGFFDASGGGGWGPLVTGNLLAQGMTPRMAIGTCNAAEFFITVTVLAAFIGMLGPEAFTLTASGLLIGGLVASPIGAWLTKRIKPAALLQIVGIALIAVGVLGFLSLMFGPFPIFPRL